MILGLISSERGGKLAKSLGLTSSRFQERKMSEKVLGLIEKIKSKDRTCIFLHFLIVNLN